MSLSIKFSAEPLRTTAFGAIATIGVPEYIGVGTSLGRPVRQILIQNLTDVLLMFSFDGIEDHFPLLSNGYLILDITSNKTLPQGFFLAEGERLYVRKCIVNPTLGAVYFTTFCGAE